jgi:hypothetical protein
VQTISSRTQNKNHDEMWAYINKHLPGNSSANSIRTALCRAGYPSEDVNEFLIGNVLSSASGTDKDVSKVYTPFGVVLDHAGSRKAFDDQSFYEEVLKPSEKAMYEKYKKDFIKNPKGKVKKLSAGFIPWPKLVVQSKTRNHMMLDRILSNTWALNKEAIPGFIDLIEKLRGKYSTVLGDDKLLEYLEAAQHRARELEVSGEVAGSQGKSETNSAFNKLRSACNLKIFSKSKPLSQGVHYTANGIPVNDNMWDTQPCLYVMDCPVWIEEGTYSGQFGRQEGYHVAYQAPDRDWCDKLVFPLDTSLEEIEEDVEQAIRQDIESDEEFNLMASSRRVFSDAQVDQQAYNNYVQQLVAMGMPEDQAREQADQMVAQIKQNTAQFVQNIQQPNQQGSAGLGASFKRYFKSAGKQLVGSSYDVDEYDPFDPDRYNKLEEFLTGYSRELGAQVDAINGGVMSDDEFRFWVEEQLDSVYWDAISDCTDEIIDEAMAMYTGDTGDTDWNNRKMYCGADNCEGCDGTACRPC